MDKSNSTTTNSPNTKAEYVPNVKAFIKELKVCTQDPARYLQRCIAVSTRGTYDHVRSYVTPNTSRELNYIPNPRPLRDICVSKNAFLSEKPDHGMITNMITSRAPGNFYTTQRWPICTSLTQGVNTHLPGSYITKPTDIAQDNKSETTENPKKLLLKMLQSTVISGKKKTSCHSKSKKRKRKRQKHQKSRRSSAQSVNALKENKKNVPNASKTNTKAVAGISIPSVTNQSERSLTKSNSMIHKMLEETEERLRITFLSNIRCSSDGTTTTTPLNDLLEKSDMFQLLNNFISKLVSCATNMHMTENNRQSGNTYVSTTVAKKSNRQVKKSLTNSQSRCSTNSKRRGSNSVELVRVPSNQQKSKTRQKKDRFSSVVLGRPGKDDTEEAELAHCTIEPDPPSAISAPYCERSSSTKVALNPSLARDSAISVDSGVREDKPSCTSNYLQRFRDPILDHGNKTKLLPQEYNSQITYVCATTELNLKGNEVDSATDSVDNALAELPAEVHKAADTSVIKSSLEQICKTAQSAEKKTSMKANISKAIGGMVSKRFAEKRSLQQRKVSDTRNKLSDTVVQAKLPPALRSKNRQMFKKQNERKLSSSTFTKVAPRVSSSYTSGGTRYMHQHRRYSAPAKESIRLNAEASAEQRFFNRNEHLLSLARPNSRYAEDTKQRFRNVLDPYRVRNLNTIIFCNQAEDQRLKRKREALETEAFIQRALKEKGRSKIFEDIPRAPNVSEASSSDSELSTCAEPSLVSNLGEYGWVQDIAIQETHPKSALSIIIEEEPEDLEHADKFYVSVCKRADKHCGVSSLISDGEEAVCNETKAQSIETTGSSVIESDYRISDRFKEEFQDVDVSELKNEIDEDNLCVLRNAEIAYGESEGSTQTTGSVPATTDQLELQLYKPVETLTSSISTFITVFDGMQMTLNDMQETCKSRSVICDSKCITQEEIQNDCLKALLRVNEGKASLNKCLRQNNEYVMRCEILFFAQGLALTTKNCYSNNFGLMLFHDRKSFEITIDSEAKSNAWNNPTATHINNTPPYFNKVDYYIQVCKTNLSMILKDYIKNTNLVSSKKKSSNIFETMHTNSMECTEYDTSINSTECNTVIKNILSLLLLNIFKNVEDRELVSPSAKNRIHFKLPLPEERVIIDTSNPNFRVDGGDTVTLSFLQDIHSRKNMDCRPLISWKFIQNMCAKFPEDRRTHLPTARENLLVMDQSYASTLRSSRAEVNNNKCPHCFQECLPDYYYCSSLQESKDTKDDSITTPELKQNSVNGFPKSDHTKTHAKIVMVGNSSGEVISYTVFPQQEYVDDSRSNILVIGEDNVHGDVTEKNQTDSAEFQTLSENLNPKKINHDFENEVSVGKHLTENRSTDTAKNNKCFSKENIFPNVCLEVPEKEVDNMFNESSGCESRSINKSSKELFSKLTNTITENPHYRSSRKDSENIHSSDFHNVHHMVWSTSSETDNNDLICEPEVDVFSSNVANDATSASSWHELTITDSPLLAGRKYQLRKGEEPACTNKLIAASLSSNSVSTTTQIDITIQGISKCTLAPDNAPKEISNSTQPTAISSTAKVAFLAFTCTFALYAASVPPGMDTIKSVIQHLLNMINAYIRQ